MLLDAGADPTLCEKGATKRSSLAIARDYKHNDCITLLLQATEDHVRYEEEMEEWSQEEY